MPRQNARGEGFRFSVLSSRFWALRRDPRNRIPTTGTEDDRGRTEKKKKDILADDP